MAYDSPKRTSNSPKSPFTRQHPGGSRPRLSSAQNTPSPPSRPRPSPSALVDSENYDPELYHPSTSPLAHRPSASPGAQSTPPSERRSFQGDHHRHRYMNQSRSRLSPKSQSGQSPAQRLNMNHQQPQARSSPRSQNGQSPGQHSSPSSGQTKPSSVSPRGPTSQSQRVPTQTRPTPQHLGAPTNAHYSPHYGSTAQPRPSASRRKAPPPTSAIDLQMDPTLQTRSRTPDSPSPSPRANQAGAIENSPRSSVRSMIQHGSHNSRSPSPSPNPSPRSGLVRKIGSVLSAPFRSSQSRRGSDASEIGRPAMSHTPSPSGRAQSALMPSPCNSPHERAARELAAILDVDGPQAPSRERLPRMPSAGESPGPNGRKGRSLTPSQLIARDAQLQESIVVPDEPERVLRVVNGLATTSTQATFHPRRPDVREVIEDSRAMAPTTSLQATPSFTTSTSVTGTSMKCDKCDELERRLEAEQDRVRGLERLVEEQNTRLDQFKNWSTAKINTLEHSLKAHDTMLQELERQQYQTKTSPDIKSTYLIALQKDFVELHSRVVALEAAGNGVPSSIEVGNRISSSVPMSGPAEQRSSSTTGWISVSASSQPTSNGRQTFDDSPQPISPIPLRSQASSQLLRTYDDNDDHVPTLPHSSCPPTISTSPLSTGLELESLGQLEPSTPKRSTWQASSPANLASKLAPLSPPTPKHATPSSPASRSPRPRYTSALGTKTSLALAFGPGSAGSPGIKRASAGPSAVDGLRLERALQTGRSTPLPSSSAFTAPNTPSHHKPWQPLDLTKNPPNGIGHSKRFSVISNPSKSVTSLPGFGSNNGSNKKPVGDLIKMFDQKKP
ncbi:hypothetical protein CROQUDRAFT_657403 [Cronartium quercuum f. sp. fusiforme G11]|uniref:Uncharacterized protein n=1 Tax=Cronartium quercuum f. sp. fusiforme G11 TaxID=708437 RepID=A0A9P6TBM4_9BASI|nr:hypothetical protein CROQUDRAFT_657403 [Cronartium quercuum f. sp. fusiforme G11]